MLVKIEEFNKETILVVSSRDLAEETGKLHKHILETISKVIEETTQSSSAEITAQWFIPTFYKDESGKSNKEYLITEQGVNLYFFNIQGYNDKKINYIITFDKMKAYIEKIKQEKQQWEIERAKGVLVRHILTDTIKMKITDSPNKKFMYPNYTKMIYKIIFGKSFDELKNEFNIKEKESLRDYITVEQLREVEHLEMLVSSLIGLGMGYAEIKDFISEKYKTNLLLVG